MKIVFLSLFLCTYAHSLALSKDSALLDEVNHMIDERLFADAYKFLQDYDPLDTIPIIVFKKHQMAQDFFIFEEYFKKFYFKNIEQDQLVTDFRGNEKYRPEKSYSLPLLDIYNRLAKKFPRYAEIKKMRVEYLYSVLLFYGKKWELPADSVAAMIEKDVQSLHLSMKAGARQYFIMGHLNTELKKYKEAIEFYNSAIEYAPKNGEYHFARAVAYMNINKLDSAMMSYKKSLNYLEDSLPRAESARMIAYVYETYNDGKSALAYYEMSNKLQFHQYYTLKGLAKYHKVFKYKDADQLVQKMFDYGPDNGYVYDDITDIYQQMNDKPGLITYFKSQKVKYKGNVAVEATLDYYLAQLVFPTDKDASEKYYLSAKEKFKTYLKADHYYFEVIEEQLSKF
jgi:tetratricopeptide (TPR) repeat protein